MLVYPSCCIWLGPSLVDWIHNILCTLLMAMIVGLRVAWSIGFFGRTVWSTFSSKELRDGRGYK